MPKAPAIINECRPVLVLTFPQDVSAYEIWMWGDGKMDLLPRPVRENSQGRRLTPCLASPISLYSIIDYLCRYIGYLTTYSMSYCSTYLYLLCLRLEWIKSRLQGVERVGDRHQHGRLFKVLSTHQVTRVLISRNQVE